MNSFFKQVFATVVGIIISTIFLMLLTIGIVALIIAVNSRPPKIEPNTVLVLELNHTIVERKPSIPFDIRNFSTERKIGMNDLLENIQKAKEDPNIKGIYLDLSFIPAGIGTVEEIRSAVLDFKASGKFVIAFGETYSQGAYYLATAADAVYLSPGGFVEWAGLRAQSPFFKNTLEKLDIEATLIRHGKFKSAGEIFTEEGFSEDNRQQLDRLITAYWDYMLENIEKERSLDADALDEMAEQLLIGTSQSAYQYGLIDSLLYEDQVLGLLKRRAGLSSGDEIRTIDLNDYDRVPEIKKYKGVAEDKIAVLYAHGDIVSGEGDANNIGADRFAEAIRSAREDKKVRALVVRINSPGGSAIASETIWRELYLTKQKKPLVVSMGDVAASGGYYIACMADSIYAQPTTITGSIGVWGLHLNSKGLFEQLGIDFDVVKTNTYADRLSGVRELTPYELTYWQNSVDSVYNTFVQRVDQGRALSFDQIDSLGQGRVWSGIDAVENGLVDHLGGLNDAILTAKRLARLGDRYRIVELPEQENPLEKLFKDFMGAGAANSIKQELGIDPAYINMARSLFQQQGVQARMPYDLLIY